MSCDTTSPRLTIVKQTYGRINKSKKTSNVENSCPSRSFPGRSDTFGAKAIKEEPVECPTMSSNHVSDNNLPSSNQHTSQRSKDPPTPTSSRLHDVLNAIPQSADPPPPSKTTSKQTSLLQFTSPRTQPPKSLALTPPRSVPNILRRTPVKQGSTSRKPATPKSKSVNLSPILYSPKVKTKNPFFNDGAGASGMHEQAHIITSYMKTPPQSKKLAPSPKKKSMGSQCNINVPRMMSLPAASPKKASCSSPKKQLFSNFDGEKVLCNVEMKSEEMMIVSHTVNGRVYSGILVPDSHRCHMAAQFNSGGYISEQFPSQYHKKLKAKLGLSFESGCESENSDSECTKNKLQKLKYSDFKAMKDSVVVSSAENLSPAEPAFSSHSESSPATTPKSRQNVPYQSSVNHDKKSINGLAKFLEEAACSSSSAEKGCSASSKTKENVGKSKEPSGKSKESISKSKEAPNKSKETPEKKKSSKESQSKVKDSVKGTKPSQPKSNSNSPKKQKLDKAKIITENLTDEIKPNKKPKLKFGEKFVGKISPSKSAGPSKEYVSTEDPATIQKKLAEVSRHFRMRSHSLDDNKALSSVLAENSAKLTYVDLEWPAWCPRKLKLEIAPVRRGRPARFKLEKNGSKRRRTESNESESEESKIEELYTENHNPFGIGDVVIAKYTPGPGRPYWPGKVLSATGLTVCVLFYNTCDVMQIAKCNVEWFYDGCKEHKITLNPANASKEWKEALEEAERDVKSCIGRESIVWGLYETEWWPARVLDIDQETYTVEWLDDNSLELLPLESLTPFLLSYNVKYSEQCAQDYDSYQPVVDQAHTLALTVLLETETVLRESPESSVKRS